MALDATTWYVQPYWTWEHAAWQPTLYYRYAFFQGDNPDTLANEARAKPGAAVKQAFNRSKDFKYGMIYLAFSY